MTNWERHWNMHDNFSSIAWDIIDSYYTNEPMFVVYKSVKLTQNICDSIYFSNKWDEIIPRQGRT